MKPAAEAWPVTAAMVGMGSVRRSLTTERRRESIRIMRSREDRAHARS